MKVRLMLVCLALLIGCGGAQTSDDSTKKMHEPPADSEAKLAPTGPEVDPSVIQSRTKRDVMPSEVVANGSEPKVSRTDVKAFMQRGPAFLLTRVEVEPVHGSGGFEGFKLVKTTNGVAEFMAPQMKLGDVVTHINGIRVERPDDYLQAWNALAGTEWIRVDFTRGDDKLHAVWSVQE